MARDAPKTGQETPSWLKTEPKWPKAELKTREGGANISQDRPKSAMAVPKPILHCNLQCMRPDMELSLGFGAPKEANPL